MVRERVARIEHSGFTTVERGSYVCVFPEKLKVCRDFITLTRICIGTKFSTSKWENIQRVSTFFQVGSEVQPLPFGNVFQVEAQMHANELCE